MKRRTVLARGILVCAGLIAGTSRAEPSPDAPPPHVAGAICRPEFQTAQGNFAAGTAFVARSRGRQKSQTVLVTAHHLFGPDGGLATQIGWKQLPGFVRSVRCAQPRREGLVFSATAPLAVPDARPQSDEGPARDVAVFRLPDAKITALELHTGKLPLKRRVWLAAQVKAGEPPEKLLHRATLVTADREWIEFEYDNSELDPTATSGAPVVDEKGRVIGINIGARIEGKKLIGVAQSAAVVLNAVDSALARAIQPSVEGDGEVHRHGR